MKKFYDEYAKFHMEIAKNIVLVGIIAPIVGIFNGISSVLASLCITCIAFLGVRYCKNKAKHYYEIAEKKELK